MKNAGRCALCDTPVDLLLYNKELNEFWCTRCIMDKGREAQRQKEQGR